uniref:Uncharacterized protein n=1 Tax=Arundo donax TaxID=35708 RepID=A0A0A9C749_ARUDO
MRQAFCYVKSLADQTQTYTERAKLNINNKSR